MTYWRLIAVVQAFRIDFLQYDFQAPFKYSTTELPDIVMAATFDTIIDNSMLEGLRS